MQQSPHERNCNQQPNRAWSKGQPELCWEPREALQSELDADGELLAALGPTGLPALPKPRAKGFVSEINTATLRKALCVSWIFTSSVFF